MSYILDALAGRSLERASEARRLERSEKLRRRAVFVAALLSATLLIAMAAASEERRSDRLDQSLPPTEVPLAEMTVDDESRAQDAVVCSLVFRRVYEEVNSFPAVARLLFAADGGESLLSDVEQDACPSWREFVVELPEPAAGP